MPESFGVGVTWQAALARQVDRADPAGDRLGDRDEQPGDRGRGREGEECVDRVRHEATAPSVAVDEERRIARVDRPRGPRSA